MFFSTSISRRGLFAGAAAATGISRLHAAGYHPLFSVQFYVWTQNFDSRKISIAEGLEEALAATRRAGYSRVELMSSFFEEPVREKTFAALRKNELEMPVVYGGAKLHEEAAAEKSIASLLELAQIVQPVGTRAIITNPDPKPQREPKTDTELAIEARSIDRLGRELAKQQMALLVHHHDPEMANGAREWRYLLRNTDPQFSSLCMDLHWVYRGHQSPMALLKEAGKRVRSIHLRNSQGGTWTEDLGDGDIDYREVARYLRDIGYDGYLVVELAYEKGTALTRPLEEDLRRSRLYAERIFA